VSSAHSSGYYAPLALLLVIGYWGTLEIRTKAARNKLPGRPGMTSVPQLFFFSLLRFIFFFVLVQRKKEMKGKNIKT
jgi:hypothetical protein